MAVSPLTEYMRLRDQRLAIEKKEEELKKRIKADLDAGKKVRNKTHEAYLISTDRRSIDANSFARKFGQQMFMAVAQVSVTKVDGLVKLELVKEDDVKEVTNITTTYSIGTQKITTKD